MVNDARVEVDSSAQLPQVSFGHDILSEHALGFFLDAHSSVPWHPPRHLAVGGSGVEFGSNPSDLRPGIGFGPSDWKSKDFETQKCHREKPELLRS